MSAPADIPDVAALVAEHADAQARADAAAAALDQHHQRQVAEREAREAEHDRALVDGYAEQVAALTAEEQQARRDFRAALLDSPAMAAWIEGRAARWARVHLVGRVQSAADRLGTGREYPQLDARDARLFDEALDLAEREAKMRGEERIERDVDEARDRYLEQGGA